jgi:hypothetical protein
MSDALFRFHRGMPSPTVARVVVVGMVLLPAAIAGAGGQVDVSNPFAILGPPADPRTH